MAGRYRPGIDRVHTRPTLCSLQFYFGSVNKEQLVSEGVPWGGREGGGRLEVR